jgi:predicted nucleic acid-binding protein
VSLPAAVIDASVAALWLLPDEASDASRRLYARMRRGDLVLHAPELWLWECGNLVANGVRHGRIAPDDALLLWSVLDAVRARVELTVPAPAQARAALALGMDAGLSLYQASYLWLALSLRLPLLTRDQPLQSAARARRVPVPEIEALA